VTRQEARQQVIEKAERYGIAIAYGGLERVRRAEQELEQALDEFAAAEHPLLVSRPAFR
jgi:hypothetical protein